MNLEVLYEDPSIIVVWKPVGLESQSSRGFGADMVSQIRLHIHKLSPKSGEPYVGVIHRLDKPVSGIMVYAKEKKAAAALSRQVAGGQMSKKYWAILCGQPVDNVEKYVDYLLKSEKENVSRIVDKGITGAKRAELICRTLETRQIEPWGPLTLAEVELCTGRHHQIRVQMAGHGLPLWGDNRYNPLFGGKIPAAEENAGADLRKGQMAGQAEALTGRPETKRPIRANVALASCYLSFTHPVTGKQMEFTRTPSDGMFREFQI